MPYTYAVHIVETLMAKVIEYALEIEHQFMDEYKDLSEDELIRDFVEYLNNIT